MNDKNEKIKALNEEIAEVKDSIQVIEEFLEDSKKYRKAFSTNPQLSHVFDDQAVTAAVRQLDYEKRSLTTKLKELEDVKWEPLKLRDAMAKLPEIAKDAVEKAVEAVKGMEDGGTCNMDSMIFFLPRAQKAKVVEACAAGGLRVFDSNRYGKTCFYVCNPDGASGQGFVRTKGAEAMRDVFKEAGIDAMVSYVID